MRWWLSTDDPQIFAVDNASVTGMDFSSLPADVWMVHWIDGKGELENQVDPLTNDNGLRTTFIDVTPYATLFQQFLAKLSLLTLAQAQQVQTDLIKQIFESKRQDPFPYTVAAGAYSWDASDEALFSSHGAQLQNNLTAYSPVTYTASATITIPPLATRAWVRMWGGSGASGSGNQGLYASAGVGSGGYLEKFLTGLTPGNTLAFTLGAAGVAVTNGNGGNGGASILASGTQTIGTLTANGSNGTSIGTTVASTTTGGTATGGDINRQGQSGTDTSWTLAGIQTPAGAPNSTKAGIGGTIGLARGPDGTIAGTGNPGFPGGLIIAWGNGNVTTGMQWIPVGATAPVAVTPAEQTAILNGIAVRTNTLAGKKNTKVAQVEALTAIPDVINYDVTTGWT